MFQERRLQAPPRPDSFCVVRQVIVGQAEDLPKIDHKSLTIVLRDGRRGEQVQSFDATFQHLIPAALRAKAGLTASNSARGKMGQPATSLTFRCSRSQICVTMIKSP